MHSSVFCFLKLVWFCDYKNIATLNFRCVELSVQGFCIYSAFLCVVRLMNVFLNLLVFYLFAVTFFSKCVFKVDKMSSSFACVSPVCMRFLTLQHTALSLPSFDWAFLSLQLFNWNFHFSKSRYSLPFVATIIQKCLVSFEGQLFFFNLGIVSLYNKWCVAPCGALWSFLVTK